MPALDAKPQWHSRIIPNVQPSQRLIKMHCHLPPTCSSLQKSEGLVGPWDRFSCAGWLNTLHVFVSESYEKALDGTTGVWSMSTRGEEEWAVSIDGCWTIWANSRIFSDSHSKEMAAVSLKNQSLSSPESVWSGKETLPAHPDHDQDGKPALRRGFAMLSQQSCVWTQVRLFAN
jgi:hypothetical protein